MSQSLAFGLVAAIALTHFASGCVSNTETRATVASRCDPGEPGCGSSRVALVAPVPRAAAARPRYGGDRGKLSGWQSQLDVLELGIFRAT